MGAIESEEKSLEKKKNTRPRTPLSSSGCRRTCLRRAATGDLFGHWRAGTRTSCCVGASDMGAGARRGDYCCFSLSLFVLGRFSGNHFGFLWAYGWHDMCEFFHVAVCDSFSPWFVFFFFCHSMNCLAISRVAILLAQMRLCFCVLSL